MEGLDKKLRVLEKMHSNDAVLGSEVRKIVRELRMEAMETEKTVWDEHMEIWKDVQGIKE